MSTPSFSVIVPSFGRPAFLRDAVESVLGQSLRDVECIVVDDASPEPITLPYHPRIRIVRRGQNGGAAASRNTGAEASSGQYIAFLDDDDWFTPDHLENAGHLLDTVDVSVAWSRLADEPAHRHSSTRLEGYAHPVIAQAVTPTLGVTAIRRAAMVPFDEGFRSVEDVDWWIRVTEYAKLGTVSSVGCVIRRHTGPRPGYGTAQRIADSHRLLAKHRQYFEEHPRALAFRWFRIGRMHHLLGEEADARRAYRRALAVRPDARTLRHYLRTWSPMGAGVSKGITA